VSDGNNPENNVSRSNINIKIKPRQVQRKMKF